MIMKNKHNKKSKKIKHIILYRWGEFPIFPKAEVLQAGCMHHKEYDMSISQVL